MKKEQVELSKEQERLKETIALIERQLEKAKNRNDELKADVIATRKEMRENSEHAIGNLWGSEAFEALAELSQFTNELNDKITDSEEMEAKIVRLQKMIASPYFARIDFKFDDDESNESIYIGRTALKNDTGVDRYIYDWRSPIASVFYRFMMGRAFYEAPVGRIAGEVTLKRQYEIKNSNLEYFFDADVQVVDEFLRKALSQNTSPQMKSIVETIQKEQDVVIRDMDNELMMVQGVAGSGKTSIALHRVAYLMYQGLSENLNAEDILIISPNSIFEQYIANVLPELGEENANSIIWEEIVSQVINKKHIQSRELFLESIIVNDSHSQVIKDSMKFKNSRSFSLILKRVIDDLLKNQIEFEDIYNNGVCIVSCDILKKKLLSGNPDMSIKTKLSVLEEYILELIADIQNGRIRKSERMMVKEYMARCAPLNIKAIYQKLFNNKDYFLAMAGGITLPEDIDKVLKYTAENLVMNRIYYDDAAALTYLAMAINGETTYQDIKQVVIDEAQDYYSLHFEIFKMLFPRAKLTVLGDINQTLEKTERMSMYQQIKEILGKKASNLVVMDKSFRCTSEILKFSSKFLHNQVKIESFNRNGETPTVSVFKEQKDFKKAIIDKIKECQALGYESIGLICKSRNNALVLFDILKEAITIQLVDGTGNEVTQGTFIIPVYMSKGLEFDAVLICDVDDKNYYRKTDKSLLYIATTRALHQLNLFCLDNLSPFLQE
jgi:Superfamily I DNA and RNA helicases